MPHRWCSVPTGLSSCLLTAALSLMLAGASEGVETAVVQDVVLRNWDLDDGLLRWAVRRAACCSGLEMTLFP